MRRYEHWQKLRTAALQSAGGVPEGYVDPEIPPPVQTVDDLDIENLSMDLSAVSIDAEIGQELDESGIERVPMADPGLDASYHEGANEHAPVTQSPLSPHVRRKSVLPVDPAVIRDLQAHRSLDDAHGPPRAGSSESS